MLEGGFTQKILQFQITIPMNTTSSAVQNVSVQKRETSSAWENILTILFREGSPRRAWRPAGMRKCQRRGGNGNHRVRQESVRRQREVGTWRIIVESWALYEVIPSCVTTTSQNPRTSITHQWWHPTVSHISPLNIPVTSKATCPKWTFLFTPELLFLYSVSWLSGTTIHPG